MSNLKLVVSAEEIRNAIKKAQINAGADFMILASGDEGKFGLMSCSMDAMAQAKVVFDAKLIAGKGGDGFICGPELAKVVDTMAGMGKSDITFEQEETTVKVQCNGATITLNCKKDMPSLEEQESGEEIGVILKAQDLKLAVNKGANYTPQEDVIVARDTLEMKIGKNESGFFMRIYSTDMKKGSLCEVPVMQAGYIKNPGNDLKEVKYAVKCRLLDFVINNLEEESVQMVFEKSTVSIMSGNVIYTLGLLEKKFPVVVEELLLKRDNITTKVRVSKKELTTAINLSAIASTSDDEPIVFKVSDGNIEVSDFYIKSKTDVKAEVDGEEIEKIGFSFSYLKSILAKSRSDDIQIEFGGTKVPVYFFDDIKNAVSMLLPVKVK